MITKFSQVQSSACARFAHAWSSAMIVYFKYLNDSYMYGWNKCTINLY